uniref:Uncharacterized protein n=1 Tax=Theileria annulata TaxID=5874 RepID=A0A3B0MS18_THEAN
MKLMNRERRVWRENLSIFGSFILDGLNLLISGNANLHTFHLNLPNIYKLIYVILNGKMNTFHEGLNPQKPYFVINMALP